jgi:hypothetical protein
MFSVAQATARVATGTISENGAPPGTLACWAQGYYHHVVLGHVFPSWWQRVWQHTGVGRRHVSRYICRWRGPIWNQTAFGVSLMVLIRWAVWYSQSRCQLHVFGWVYERHWNFDIQIHYQEAYESHIDPDDQEMEILHAMVVAAFKRHILSQCVLCLMPGDGFGMVFKTRTKNS